MQTTNFSRAGLMVVFLSLIPKIFREFYLRYIGGYIAFDDNKLCGRAREPWFMHPKMDGQ